MGAIFHLHHNHVGKRTHDAGTAAAHVKYIVRKAACTHVVSVGGVPNKPHAMRAEAERQERTNRANARVCDKLVISFPNELTPEQQIWAIRHFLVRVTQNGRSRAFACFHGQKTHHPHSHVVVFDRDTDTGKRVFRTTDRGSTERLRQMWEHSCNEALARFGHDIQIDHRSYERQLEEACKAGDIVSEHEIRNRLAKSKRLAANENEHSMDTALIQDDEIRPEQLPLPARVKAFEKAHDDYHMLDQALRSLVQLQARLPALEDLAKEANNRLGGAEDHEKQALANKRVADARAEGQTTRHGQLKGKFSVFGMTFTTKRGEEGLDKLRAAKKAQEEYKRSQFATSAERKIATQKQREYEAAQSEKAKLDQMLSAWGQSHELQDARQMMLRLTENHFYAISNNDLTRGHAEGQVSDEQLQKHRAFNHTQTRTDLGRDR